jgi:SnoaL-like protein
MNGNLPKDVLESADITVITQLILRERESRDLGRWERMRGCFWPDSHVRVTWFRGNGADFVTGSIDMARRGVLAKHRLGPILVNLAGNRAVASLSAIIDIPTKLQGMEFTLSSHTRFLYRVERRAGRWGIISFDAIYVRDELTSPIPGQSLKIDAEELKRFRSTYRMLSYCLSMQGYEVDTELAGEDRPDSVDALNQELYGWAGVKI